MFLDEGFVVGVCILVIGVVNRGGVIFEKWKVVLILVLEKGYDLVFGLYNLLWDEGDLVVVV